MTKVFAAIGKFGVACALGWALVWGCAALAEETPVTKSGPAEALYLQLSDVGLDASRVFRVRNGALDRPSIQITLEDGTIAFTKDVMGRITGAFFEGDGEVLLTPPNEVERRSMSLFTGMAILEERFSSAYFRFNDDTAAELQPSLRRAEDAAEFVTRWDATARALAQTDAMRLLRSFSEMLPAEGAAGGDVSATPDCKRKDRMLHARLQGNKLGSFDVLFDAEAAEQVEAGQLKASEDGGNYYDVWSSFAAERTDAGPARIQVRDYGIDARITPPKELDAKVTMRVEFTGEATRFMAFELSRYLKIQSVEQDGKAVEFIQNPALEGTRLARRGDDLVGVVLPQAPRRGEVISLRFIYSGEVLAEAGKGLLYVGARGTWYPNLGFAMANFDMTFHYPPAWTLLATGKPQAGAGGAGSSQSGEREQVTRWVSERPIPVAGFDLGKYVRASAQAGEVTVEAYATAGVEKDFPRLQGPAPEVAPHGLRPEVLPPPVMEMEPSPARNARAVAEATAHAIDYYAQRFGPFPYSHLALTQLPGPESQGWPGLVFLSSYAFLNSEEEHGLHLSAAGELLSQQVPAHEAAHQWWGDLVTWSTYRDQWFSEGLANYCALMILQKKDPAGFEHIMEKYRRDLVEKDKQGNMPKDAGPVTLGSRLLSSHFPGGYEAISYGRATWLFHMLRSMMLDGEMESAGKDGRAAAKEEPFVRSLRRVRELYAGKAISTEELLNVFAAELAPSVRYEGKASLAWFLESWVNGTELPRLELHGVKFLPHGNGVEVSGIIRQKDAGENLVTSVPVYAVASGSGAGGYKGMVRLGRVFADGPETSFRLWAPAGTHRVVLDPLASVLTSPN